MRVSIDNLYEKCRQEQAHIERMDRCIKQGIDVNGMCKKSRDSAEVGLKRLREWIRHV